MEAIHDYAKDGGEEFLPRCFAFYNRIPIDSLTIPDSNAMHLGKMFLAAIFSVIVYWQPLTVTVPLLLLIFHQKLLFASVFLKRSDRNRPLLILLDEVALSSIEGTFQPLLLILFVWKVNILQGWSFSPDDICYPMFLLFFIIGGYIEYISYFVEFFNSDFI